MDYVKSDYDKVAASNNQTKYCKEHGAPEFAPKFGQCFRCKGNIYQPIAWAKNPRGRFYSDIEVPLDSPEAIRISGITVKEAGTTLVTGCPHCHASYCE